MTLLSVTSVIATFWTMDVQSRDGQINKRKATALLLIPSGILDVRNAKGFT